jgi:hypothetical protein
MTLMTRLRPDSPVSGSPLRMLRHYISRISF